MFRPLRSSDQGRGADLEAGDETGDTLAMESLVLFFHLLGVLVFAAGVAVAAVAFDSARRRERVEDVALLLGLARTGALLVVSGGALLLVCGLWLVDLAEVGFGAGWLDAAIALFAAALAFGGLGGQRPKQARVRASRLASEGRERVDGRLRDQLDDPLSRVANYASAALILAVLALMVFKP
jgi:uncharacterized membrane protein